MKTHDERMYEHLYSNEGRVEQCERICKLEELAKDMWFYGYLGHIEGMTQEEQMEHIQDVLNRMRKLDVEIEYEHFEAEL